MGVGPSQSRSSVGRRRSTGLVLLVWLAAIAVTVGAGARLVTGPENAAVAGVRAVVGVSTDVAHSLPSPSRGYDVPAAVAASSVQSTGFHGKAMLSGGETALAVSESWPGRADPWNASVAGAGERVLPMLPAVKEPRAPPGPVWLSVVAEAPSVH